MKTGQEIFDFAVVHMDKQRAGSFISEYNDTCAYRGIDGKMCIVGAMIKDEFYNPLFEGVGVTNSSVMTALVKSGVDTFANGVFLIRLQGIHDSWTKRNHDDLGNLKERFEFLADTFNLSTSILDGKFE